MLVADIGPPIVAAGAGLAGALAGGFATWAVARQQIRAQADEREADRKHEEKWRRRELYAEFYGAVSDTFAAWMSLAAQDSRGPDPFTPEFYERYRNFARIQGMVRLYASGEVAAAAEGISECLRAVQNDVVSHLASDQPSPTVQAWIDHRTAFGLARDRFVESIRVQNTRD